MFADLHLHTNFSDGTFTPEELVGHGVRVGLAAMALTDHDTVEGCPRMATACQRAEIEFIPGTELTTEHGGNELHLLAYCIDPTDQQLLVRMARCQQVRQERIREMVSKLNSLDIPLRSETVFALANCRSPGRPHVARALVREKLCHSLDEAFERFLKKGKPAWVPKFRMSALQAIELIQKAGGVAVMAHPGLNRTDEMIPELVEAGLDGIECFHSRHSTAMAERYLTIADRHRLLVTGGSDCHGLSKGRPLIGKVKLPYQHVEQLKARARERQQSIKSDIEQGAPISPAEL
jgi:hypothetical protein